MKNKKDIKKLKSIITLLFVIVLLLGGLSVYLANNIFFIINGNKENIVQKPVLNNNTDNNVVEIDKYKAEKELFENNYAINEDYLCTLRFDSGLIEEPIMKAETHDEYLRVNWKTKEYDVWGTVYLDPNADVNSQNMTFYGHNGYPGDTEKFEPLHLLENKEVYKDNKYFSLIFKNEIRKYEIAHLYNAKIYLDRPEYPIEEGMEYMFPYFDEDAFEHYIKRVKEEELFDTGVIISKDDRFVTFQTCVTNRPDLRLIVVAKEIEVIEFR